MWREAHGYATGISPAGTPMPNGSMLTTKDAAGFVNFLSPQVAAATAVRRLGPISGNRPERPNTIRLSEAADSLSASEWTVREK
jgi:hypothetical protein